MEYERKQSFSVASSITVWTENASDARARVLLASVLELDMNIDEAANVELDMRFDAPALRAILK